MRKKIVLQCLFFKGMRSAQEANDSIRSKYINEVEIIGFAPMISTAVNMWGRYPRET